MNTYCSEQLVQLRFQACCLIWASKKKIIQPSSAISLLCRDFYRLPIAISVDHWEPRILFFSLIN